MNRRAQIVGKTHTFDKKVKVEQRSISHNGKFGILRLTAANVGTVVQMDVYTFNGLASSQRLTATLL